MELTGRDLDPQGLPLLAQQRLRDGLVRVRVEHVALECRAEMTFHLIGQSTLQPLPVRALPRLQTLAHRARLQHPILHHELRIALEPIPLLTRIRR